ncbi:MAG TPA: GNAT family N-acetyltransferase [Phenylobacterium sp.]
MIETERLLLRVPHKGDLDAITAINADPRVSEWLGSRPTAADSPDWLRRVEEHHAEYGYGFWSAVRKADHAVVGFAGLLATAETMPVGPAVEVAWRFHPLAWGAGYATEAARASIDWGWANVDVDELIAITARRNLRSQAVMRRLGMTYDASRDFDHPRLLAPDDPLRAHVTYALQRGA